MYLFKKIKQYNTSSLITIILALLVNKNVAQTTSFITYGMEQGLIQNQIESIIQDEEGNLWVSTIAGLTKYNGSEFTSYTKNQGLAEDWITTSYKDKENNIWFGHWAGGLTRYNSKLKTLENLNLEEYTHFKTIRTINQDKAGKYWITTEGAGVFVFDAKNNKMFSITTKEGLPSNIIYDMIFDDQENAWLATDSGLVIYDASQPISSPKAYISLTIKKGLFSKNITCLLQGKNNELWIGSADKGLARITISKEIQNTKEMIASQQILNEKNGLKSNFIKIIRSDIRNTIWVGTIGGGVSLLNYSKNTTLADAVFKTYSTRQGLNYFNVNTIFEDRENTIWIGTDLGLNQFRGERLQVLDEADSIPNNIIWSTYCDKEGNLWLGTNNGLAKITIKYDADGHIAHRKVKEYTTSNGLKSSTVLAVFEDSKNNIWIGTGFGGAFKLAEGSKKFVQYSVMDGLASDMVYSIAEDKEGNIWFGTKEGASKLSKETEKEKKKEKIKDKQEKEKKEKKRKKGKEKITNYTTNDGLGGNHIYRIFKDKKGLLWMAALGGNLCVYDGSTFKRYDESTGLKHRFILCIDEDSKGNIWFGCYGGGLYKFDGKTFYNYNSKQGLHCESPFSIVADAQDNIWMGTNHGIEKFEVSINRFVFYGRNDGFMGVECNPNSACIDKLGNIWFGTIMGAVKFNPKQDRANIAEPLVSIRGLKLHLQDTVFPSENIFRYNENNITFKFVGVSLTNPEKIKYEYTLEGFDRGWVPANYLVKEATYTNLPAGKYIFKVKACNNDGIWSSPTFYSFTVKPPFWQTLLFYLFVAVFVVFAIYVFDKMRTKKLKKAKTELEQKVKERTLQLAIKNSELAEKNKDITDSIRYAKRVQESSLHNHQTIKQLLNQSFILFKPKDIVSGDFIWAIQKENIKYIAVVDCTGHGVPGAFLSIVANSLIEKTFAECTDTEPGKLLDYLSVLASTALKTSNDGYQMRDGMDIALCKIDTTTNKAEFAGAYNSLCLVRNNKVIEYFADNISIGVLDENQKYTNHVFNLENNDVLYLFSDGFADQFGGEKGKKYKTYNFQNFLLQISNQAIEEQASLLENEFKAWKGDLEQVDDLTVVGIRI